MLFIAEFLSKAPFWILEIHIFWCALVQSQKKAKKLFNPGLKNITLRKHTSSWSKMTLYAPKK